MKRRWWWSLTMAMSAGIAMAQSSPGFRMREGRLSASSQTAAPASPGFRVEGGINADSNSGLAASPNFRVASGVQARSELVFRNGFEN